MAAEQMTWEPQPAYMERRSCLGPVFFETMDAQAALLPRLFAWHWIFSVSMGYRMMI